MRAACVGGDFRGGQAAVVPASAASQKSQSFRLLLLGAWLRQARRYAALALALPRGRPAPGNWLRQFLPLIRYADG
jgi:hypothetical protein